MRATSPVWPDLRRREVRYGELMDDPECDIRMLENTYALFPAVNAVVAGWRSTYRTRIRPLLSSEAETTLLDLGCGGGDLARSFARWAKEDGLRLRVTGVDPDARAFRYAHGIADARGSDDTDVRFRSASSGMLVAEGARFDIVVSNHVLHHLTDSELSVFLADSSALSTRLVVHGDIERARPAYLLYGVLTAWMPGPATPGLGAPGPDAPDATRSSARPASRLRSFIRYDGLLSIRRSHRAHELSARVAPEWRVVSTFPFRLLVVLDRTGAARREERP